MRRWWRRSLARQIIVLLVVTMFGVQAIGFWFFGGERVLAVAAAHQTRMMDSLAALVRLLEDTPPDRHGRILGRANSRDLRFWMSSEPAVDPARAEHPRHHLYTMLGTLLEGSSVDRVLIALGPADGFRLGQRDRRSRAHMTPPHHGDSDRRDRGDRDRRPEGPPRAPPFWRGEDGPPAVGLTVSLQLAGGAWLNAEMAQPRAPRFWALPSLVFIFLSAAVFSVLIVFLVRRLNRPLAALAQAAEHLGRGEPVDPVPEAGPEDLRRTTRAFNRMNDRLQRFVQDRTRMLAAVSHDLRTPITALRLRAEMVEDAESRDSMLKTLEEMQQMVEGVLAFAREDAAREDTRVVDLVALVESVCDDIADIGGEIDFAPAERRPYACRPVALKRALRNLMDNAVRYGARARVALETDAAEIRIIVDDDGPGIPEAEFERVFAPFVRLEESRSRETGGSGLGLAIARTIARAHGGDITLENRVGGGLRAVLRLPAE